MRRITNSWICIISFPTDAEGDRGRLAPAGTGKDGDEDHELSHQRQAELYCPVQILRKTASAGLHVPGV